MRRALPIVLALTAGGCFTLDFDGDGVIDRPPPAGYETDELSCANGRDDDQDGRIDCQDSDCLMNGHCGEQIPLTPPLGVENTFELAQALFEAARASSAKQSVDGQQLPRTFPGFSVPCRSPSICLRRSFHSRCPDRGSPRHCPPRCPSVADLWVAPGYR